MDEADGCQTGEEAECRKDERTSERSSRFIFATPRVVRLVAEAGEELVGLCYFGDQRSREHIKAQLTLESPATDS
jgi:hypothetical protein